MEKLRRKNIEDLSNEIFYEIFDYLDGCEIYESFFNLNHRFRQFLHCSSILLRIKFNSKSDRLYEDFYKKITHINKQQIYSLNLDLALKINDFYSSFTFDSSLNHLKSITLNQLEQNFLVIVLSNLLNLPELSSLTINTFDVMKRSTDIYRIILRLPMLTYFKFSANNCNLHIALPMASSEQYNSIKYLIINHCCTFAELAVIVSYTPQLRFLDYFNNNFNRPTCGIILPITLKNLKRLSLRLSEIKYEEFEIFISQFNAKLKDLTCITLSEDVLYFDATRWEEIIRKYLPDLKRFYFLYYEYIDSEYQPTTYLGEPDQFLSSFWIERQWGYEIIIEHQSIMYLISTYEKRWYEYHTEFDRQYSKSAQLILKDLHLFTCHDLINIYLNRALTVAQYYHLEILDDQIFGSALIHVVNCLSQLQTLKIHSLLLEKSNDLNEEEVDILSSREDTNQITKIYLKTMTDMAEIYFLIVLCPQLQYLRVDYIMNMDVESFVREILHKISFEKNEYLRLLRFYVGAADDQTIKNLEKMIDDEKLLVVYSIKRVRENIYLQWK